MTYIQVYGDTPADNVVDFAKALMSPVESGTPTFIEDGTDTVIPLPAAFSLFGSALTVIAFLGRHRRKVS